MYKTRRRYQQTNQCRAMVCIPIPIYVGSFTYEGLPGVANWFTQQFHEARTCNEVYAYMASKGNKVELQPLEKLLKVGTRY